MISAPTDAVSPPNWWRVSSILLIAALPLMPPLLGQAPKDNPLFWGRYLVLILILLSVYGLHKRLNLPQLLIQRRPGAYLLRVVALATVALLVANVVMFTGPPPVPDHRLPYEPVAQATLAGLPQPPQPPRRARPRAKSDSNRVGFNVIVLLATGMLVGLSTQSAYARHNQEEQHRRYALEREKTQVELSYLKAQLNPHLFFNTLNNIYGLTEVDPAKARVALYQLSRLMRYVLYQTQEATVLLSQEILFLQDYVALMQLRLTASMTVEFRTPAQPDDYPLAPLLVLPFLENAFKHGVSTDEPATISIHLEQADGTLNVLIRNRIFPGHATALAQDSGIGLVNTRRRLDLLYPNRYELRVGPDPARPAEFVASLALRLVE